MQTVVSPSGQPFGIVGAQYDNAEGVQVDSFFNTGSASIPFGCAVQQDVAAGQERGAKAISAANNIVIGISAHSYDHAPDGTTGDLDSVGLVQYGGGQLARTGKWIVPVAAALTIVPGDRAYCLFEADGVNTRLGIWSNANTGAHYIDMTKVAVFRTGVFTAPTATGGSALAAVLDINFVNKP